MKGRILFVLQHDDPSESSATDVSEAVQALYDHLINSMDWGSGFLSYEDVQPIAQLAALAGFEGSEEAFAYLRTAEGGSWAYTQERDARLFKLAYPNVRSERFEPWVGEEVGLPGPGRLIHEHVFSSQGTCIWAKCGQIGDPDPRITALLQARND